MSDQTMTDFVRAIAEHMSVSPDAVEVVVRRHPTTRARHCKVCASLLGHDTQALALGVCSGSCARAAADVSAAFHDRVANRLLPPTRETVLPVDATLPAIAAALTNLRASLARNGTAQQLTTVDAIAIATREVRATLRATSHMHDLSWLIDGL